MKPLSIADAEIMVLGLQAEIRRNDGRAGTPLKSRAARWDFPVHPSAGRHAQSTATLTTILSMGPLAAAGACASSGKKMAKLPGGTVTQESGASRKS